MEKIRLFFFPEVPKGIKLVTWATSLRWFGWGFVETLVPIYLFSFNHNYADTGILRSIYGIVFILILPFVAWLANRISSKYLLIAGLLMYPFISLSYFFAGGFGLVALIIIARALNGVAYALDSVGRDTYIRSHTTENNIASSFGYFDTLTNFWWLVAVAISLVLIKWVAIKYLFLAILPTALLALFFVTKISTDKKSFNKKENSLPFLSSYREFLQTIFQWNGRLLYITILLFVVDSIWIVISFFVPIYAYASGDSLVRVILLTGFVTLPSLLALPLGVFADKKWKSTIPTSFIAMSGLLLLLTMTTHFYTQLALVFIVGVLLQLVMLIANAEATQYVIPEKMGSLSAGLQGASELAEIMAPIVLGIGIEVLTFNITIRVFAVVVLLIMMAPVFIKSFQIRTMNQLS